MQARIGLTSAEAKSRLARYGHNELEERRLATAFENIFKILMDPMGLMLLILSAVYWTLDKHGDAIILLIAYIPIVGIDVLLEIRSQKALQSLKKSLKKTCQVIRDGKTSSIPVRDLVPGDLLILEEGHTIPADAKLLEASNLTVDESSVTGESIPIEKAAGAEALSGTTVLTGSGIVEVEKTGLSSQIGSIAKILMEFESVPSPLLRTIRKVVKVVFLAALGLSALVFIADLSKGKGVAEALISSLTLAMAAIPEEFPLVFTLYLSLAAYRLSRKGILVKSLPAVEGLARVDVICTDKTGTLTEGKFQLERVLGAEGGQSLSEDDFAAFIFSCESKAVDAMEVSIFEWIRENKGESFISGLHEKWELQFDYPFDPKAKYMSHVWIESTTGRQLIAMKGAIEGVLSHCEGGSKAQEILALAKRDAAEGKRILGLAAKIGKFSGNRASDEQGLKLIGALSFTDPVRPGVKSAVRSCVERGIKIKMLTGDHLLTAHAIADQVSLPHDHDQLFTGPEIERLSEIERSSAYRRGAIFARLKPEQKLELVEALKAEGDIVAMTGDGINDAPALKLADVGISMGERATDVARSSAQLVLMKNDFGGIVFSVLEGQRVLKSLSESFGYLIGFHVPIICVALYQSFFLSVPILLPIHIVLLEMIVHPISTLVFVNSESNPVKHREFITRRKIVWSSVRGLLLTALTVLSFYLVPGPDLERRGAAVLMFVAGNAGLLSGETGGLLGILNRTAVRSLYAVLILICLTALLAFANPIAAFFSIGRPSLEVFVQVLVLGLGIGLTADRRNS